MNWRTARLSTFPNRMSGDEVDRVVSECDVAVRCAEAEPVFVGEAGQPAWCPESTADTVYSCMFEMPQYVYRRGEIQHDAFFFCRDNLQTG